MCYDAFLAVLMGVCVTSKLSHCRSRGVITQR